MVFDTAQCNDNIKQWLGIVIMWTMSWKKADTTRFNDKIPKNIPRIHFPDARIQLY